MTALDRIRGIAQTMIDEADHMVDEVGIAGAVGEIGRASLAREIIAALDEPGPAMIDESRIPPMIRKTLDDYRDHHLRPGSGIRAVLSNQLAHAFSFCDEQTCSAMRAILAYVDTFPRDSWGSPEVVSRWLAKAVA